MYPIICHILFLCLFLCMCLYVRVGNARPLRGLEPYNIGVKKDTYPLMNDKNERNANGQQNLPSYVSKQRMIEKYAYAKASNEGNNFAFPYKDTASEITEDTEITEITKKRKQWRIIMEEPKMGKSKEKVDPKQDDMGEDIDVMDYAQPHRKPPIHNITP